MATARTTLKCGQARDELAREIRKRRKDCLIHETARQLLAYDQPGHTTVVGIDAEASRAICYHESDRYALTVVFGPDGLADGGAEIADFRTGPRIEAWVRSIDGYWGWVQPRYR